MRSVSVNNECSFFCQRLTIAASFTLSISTIVLLIFMNYPSIGGTSFVFTALVIEGVSFFTILVGALILQFPRKRLIQEPDSFDAKNPFNIAEVLTHIFSILGIRDLVACSLTCKKWHVFAEDSYLWNQKFILYWSMPAPESFDKLKMKKACVLLSSTHRFIEELQRPEMKFGEARFRYKEWLFKSSLNDVCMKKYGSDEKSVTLKSSNSPLMQLYLQNGELYALYQDVIHVWDCETGKPSNTFDTFTESNCENDLTCKSFFLSNEKWIIFSHKRYAFNISRYHESKKKLYRITVEYISKTKTHPVHAVEEFIVENLDLWDAQTAHGHTATVYNDMLYLHNNGQIHRLDLNTQTRLSTWQASCLLSNMVFIKDKMYAVCTSGILSLNLLKPNALMPSKLLKNLHMIKELRHNIYKDLTYKLSVCGHFLVYSLLEKEHSNDITFYNLHTQKYDTVFKAIGKATGQITQEAKQKLLELVAP